MGQKLGQHFLINEAAAKKIAAALEIVPSDTVIEIGPGRGELTKYLIRFNPQRIIAVEKDERLARRLKILFPDIEIIEGDILKILADLPCPAKIIGNIPYYLTGRLLRNLAELPQKPPCLVLTLQKEVALRLNASPPKMNLLAAAIKYWAKPEILGFIPKTDFQPAPKVDSAIIRLKPRLTGPINHLSSRQRQEEEKYYRLIKIIFKQPRKTILNNLSAGLKKDKQEVRRIIESLGINPLSRPQDLSVQTLLQLSRIF